MDYFDKNFSDFDSSDHSDLPEGFGWKDMKDGIYNRMEEEKSAPVYKKYWPFLLLLLMVGCGTGSWFALNQNNNKELAENRLNEKTILEESSKTTVTTDLKENESTTTETNIVNENREHELPSELYNNPKNINTIDIQKTEPVKNISNKPVIINQKALSKLTLTNKPVTENNAQIGPSTETPAEIGNIPEDKPGLATINKTELPSANFGIFPEATLTLPLNSAIAEAHKPVLAIRPYLQVSLSAGIATWTTLSNNNVNQDNVSGYPGYVINPSVQLFIRPKHALQMDYEFAAVEELFDYNGSRPISVSKENVVVEELVSSLTGNVINSERKNVIVPGQRKYREVKYNQYQFHALSLGYHFATAKRKRSGFGFYTGLSYLFEMNQEGKRLNEDLDVVAFDNENAVFTNHQFGLRFGLNYDFSLTKNTALFSQLTATQYLTNWEVGTSNTSTRPLLYGLQIGIRKRL